jgi:hypothetical protein
VSSLWYFVKQGLHKSYADTFALLQGRFDDAVSSSYLFSKAVRKLLYLWRASKRGFAGSIIDVDATDNCMKADTGFKHVEKNLCVVVQSKLGMKMCGPALRELQCAKVVDEMKKTIKTLMETTVTSTSIEAGRATFAQSCKDIVCMHGPSARRRLARCPTATS